MIKVLIMSSVRDVHDFSLFFFGLIKFKEKYLKEGGRKNRVNRVIVYQGISWEVSSLRNIVQQI